MVVSSFFVCTFLGVLLRFDAVVLVLVLLA
jgi:hypothetical protein